MTLEESLKELERIFKQWLEDKNIPLEIEEEAMDCSGDNE